MELSLDTSPQKQVVRSSSRPMCTFQRTKVPSSFSSALFVQGNSATGTPSNVTVAGAQHSLSVNEESKEEVTNSQESSNLSKEDEIDDDEYEYVHYQKLTEEEFVDSNWMIRMVRFGHLDDIEEAQVRLFRSNGKNLVEWGDGGTGDWWFDRTTQQLLISRQVWWWGRTTWTCVVDDYYYLEGLYRRWTFVTPLSVIGQWQGIREDDEGEVFPPEFIAAMNNSTSSSNSTL